MIEDFLRYHATINASIIAIVDHIPDDELDEIPGPGEWSYQQILVHIARARHYWLDRLGAPGQMSALSSGMTKSAIKDLITESWDRFVGYASGAGPIDTDVVFSRLTHDVHHRAELLWGLVELGTPAHVIAGLENYGPQPDPLER